MCTMFAKKKLPASSAVRAYRRELEYLYARRSAIDALMESLQAYDRFRAIRMDGMEESKLQTA